jgi:hypothetical protein
VLQAAVIAEGGQICVLDMGEPVKIVDLARNLILLSGLKPDEEIKIKFTGMRPGEKLYEELSTLLEDTAPTVHEKIRIYVGNGVPEGDIEMWLLCLREACETRDAGRLVVALKEIVLDYSPGARGDGVSCFFSYPCSSVAICLFTGSTRLGSSHRLTRCRRAASSGDLPSRPPPRNMPPSSGRHSLPATTQGHAGFPVACRRTQLAWPQIPPPLPDAVR